MCRLGFARQNGQHGQCGDGGLDDEGFGFQNRQRQQAFAAEYQCGHYQRCKDETADEGGVGVTVETDAVQARVGQRDTDVEQRQRGYGCAEVLQRALYE